MNFLGEVVGRGTAKGCLELFSIRFRCFDENLEVDRGAVSSAVPLLGDLDQQMSWRGEYAWRMGQEPSRLDPSIGHPKPRRLLRFLDREFRSTGLVRLPSQGTPVVASGRREK